MPSATSNSPEITEPRPPILPNTPISDATRDTQYRVLYDFQGQVESELTVKKDDLVVIVLKENNGTLILSFGPKRVRN
jgi:SH3 domain